MNAGERVKLSQEIIADNIEYSRTPTHLGYEGLLIDYYNHVYSYDQFESEVKKNGRQKHRLVRSAVS